MSSPSSVHEVAYFYWLPAIGLPKVLSGAGVFLPDTVLNAPPQRLRDQRTICQTVHRPRLMTLFDRVGLMQTRTGCASTCNWSKLYITASFETRAPRLSCSIADVVMHEAMASKS
jgi:hypothetical protein